MPVLRSFQSLRSARTATAAIALLATTATARATPPTTELPAGGIVFANQDRLAVEQEELSISLDAIDLKYVVRNLESTRLTLPMAFALPTIDLAALVGAEVVIPAFEPTNPTNFIGFWTTAGTTTIEPDVDVRAYVLGSIDITRSLTELGLPLYPFTPDLLQKLESLTSEQRSALRDAGTIGIQNQKPVPLWSLRTAFHWRTTLQPGETITIQHHYKPIAGSAPWSAELASTATQKYCLTTGMVERLNKLTASGKAPTVYWIHYHTGAHGWQKGPAERFKLIVEKPTDTSIVSTCFGDLKPNTGPALEWLTEDRVDDVDIEILIVE
jgi:Domain of unknown function (DUF4424)